MDRNSVHDYAVGWPIGSTVLQIGASDPNWRNAPFSTVCRPPESIEGKIFLDEGKVRDSHGNWRSNLIGLRPRSHRTQSVKT